MRSLLRSHIVLVLMLVLTGLAMLPGGPFAMKAMAEDAIPVETAADLNNVAADLNANGGSKTVKLINDITPTGDGYLRLSKGELTILGEGKTLKTTPLLTGTAILNLGMDGYDGTLECVTGRTDAGFADITDTSVLNIYDGTTINRSSAIGTAGGIQAHKLSTINMYDGGTIEDCHSNSVAGGIYLDGNAVFNMHGGTISNCTGGAGGGVGLSGGNPIGGTGEGRATFSMYGGTIENCTDWYHGGGGVSAYTSYPVTINIQGGKIKNCNATGTGSSAYGGGGICLFAFSGASFQMDGGTIEGCSCADSKYGFGGGVLLYVTGTHDVQFKKGTIKDNRAIDGGGLFVWQGHAVVDDGFGLYNNTASDGGDDIYNYRGKVTLGTVDTSATLEPCKHPITDWYEDVENRWSYKDCTGKDDYLEPFTHTGEAYSEEYGLKAAHGEFKYTVTWLSQDGQTILEKDENVDAGDQPEYNGAEPTKEPTDQYTYTFAGWATDPDQESGTAEGDLPAVKGDTSYYAAFSETLRTYTVKWMNGSTLLETDTNVPYGNDPEYNGKEPTKSATDQYTYTFAGWEPEIKQVNGDATYKAVFTEKLREYTVDFDSRGGSSVGKETVPYGNTVSKPADPKMDGARFVGWFLNGKPYDFKTPVHGDFTVVAMWIRQAIPTNDPSEDDPGDDPGGGAGGTTPGNNGNNGNRGNNGNNGNNAAAPANPAAAAPVAQNAPANTVIADNETPLDDGETILDDPVPQAVPKGQWALINLICTILTVLGAAGLATRRRKDDEDEDEDTGRKRNMCKIGAAVCAVISVIVLFLTEDFTQPMQMLDKYTVLMIVILALCAAFLMMYRILSPEQEESEES